MLKTSISQPNSTSDGLIGQIIRRILNAMLDAHAAYMAAQAICMAFRSVSRITQNRSVAGAGRAMLWPDRHRRRGRSTAAASYAASRSLGRRCRRQHDPQAVTTVIPPNLTRHRVRQVGAALNFRKLKPARCAGRLSAGLTTRKCSETETSKANRDYLSQETPPSRITQRRSVAGAGESPLTGLSRPDRRGRSTAAGGYVPVEFTSTAPSAYHIT